MRFTVNGAEREFGPNVTTAAQLLEALQVTKERVAVLINENVVRRAALEETALSDGDIIEIITMVGGG